LAWRLAISTCGEAEFVLTVRPELEQHTSRLGFRIPQSAIRILLTPYSFYPERFV
jgi:hypothetical protein